MRIAEAEAGVETAYEIAIDRACVSASTSAPETHAEVTVVLDEEPTMTSIIKINIEKES